MTGLGVWALVDKVPWIGELVGNDLLTGAVYVLLVGGIVVAFIAFFGCVGASREVKCMLLTVSSLSYSNHDNRCLSSRHHVSRRLSFASMSKKNLCELIERN